MRGWHQAGDACLKAAFCLIMALAMQGWGRVAQAQGTAPAEPKPVIKKIDVEGNQRVSRSAIRGAMRIKEGDVYEPKAVDDDVTHLWTLGAFEDIKVERQPVEGGIRLLITVRERKIVTKVVFAGNKALKDAKLLEVLDFKPKDYLNHFMVQSGRDRLLEKYREEGHQFAEVTVKVEEAGREVTVLYAIKEGPKVRVRAINFTGNTAYSAVKLRSLIQTSIYRWILSPGVYKEETLANDLLIIRDFYRTTGWLDVFVTRELSYSADKTALTVTIHIQEGERYKVEVVVISGNDLFTGAEIRKLLVLKEGTFFGTEEMRRDQTMIQDMYGEQGHIDAQVKPRTSLGAEGAKINLRYEIEEKRRVYVERVLIRNNEKTRDHVIRREITLTPGERFDTRKVRESQARLRNTGLFQAYDAKGGIVPIRFDTEPGSAPDRRDLVAEVSEGKTGEMNLGVGISSNAGLVGEFSVTQENFDITDLPKSWSDFFGGNSFVGGGQTLTLRARPGVERQDYLLSFRDPSVFDTEYGFGTSAFFAQRVRDEWDESRIGGTISVDRAFWRYWRTGVTLIPESVEVSNLTDAGKLAPDIVDAQGRHGNTSIKFDITRETRDNRFLPTSGSRVEASLQIFSTAMGGDYEFVKAEVEVKNYFTVFNIPGWGKHVLSVGADVGIAKAFGNTDRVPIFNRFFAGGPGDAASLRGFRFRGIGPVQGPDVQVGGEVLMLNTVEYEFPIYQEMIRAVVFGDVGKVASTVETFSEQEIRASVGTGLRLRFPFFGGIPIAMDWGVPVSKQPEDRVQVFSFSIGTGFRF